jgi:hypothetical protein
VTAIRLAVYMKDSILMALTEHAFKTRDDALTAEKVELGKKVYEQMYTAEERRLMAKLPADFLGTEHYQRVKFGGDYTNLPLGGEHRVANGRGAPVFSASHEFTDIYRDIDKREKLLAQEKKQARVEAKAKLNSASTVQRLIDIWPEVRPFAEPYLKTKKTTLPVPVNDVLNRKFNLPVSDAKAAKKGSRK